MLDKYQAAYGDVAVSSKWNGTQNLTYKWYLFSQGSSQHGNREGWIRFFLSGDYFIGRRMDSVFFSTDL